MDIKILLKLVKFIKHLTHLQKRHVYRRKL